MFLQPATAVHVKMVKNMENNSKDINVYFAKNIHDAAYYLRTVPDLSITAGCTGIMYNKNPCFLTFPYSLLSVRKVEEAMQIDRTERYIEFGAAVTLSQILQIGQKRLPQILYEAISTIANPQVRNMATIGGNICTAPMKMTCFAPLLALEAKLEFRTGTEKAHTSAEKRRSLSEIETINITQFKSVPKRYFLNKITVPLDDWDISIFKRVGAAHQISELSAAFVFLAKTQKNMLNDLRIAYCGIFSFRKRELENILIGSKLPLNEKTVQNFCEKAEEIFDQHIQENMISYNPVLKAQFLNLLNDSMQKLSN